MNDDAIVFAMANPTPEVMPEDAAPYVRIMATGRSDYPNQINNVLAFPGIFRGALDAGAPSITEEMKLAAAKGIAMAVSEDDLAEDYIIPSVFNRDVAPKVAEAVVEEAKRDGIARLNEETGTFATVDGDRERPGTKPMKVLVTGASGLIGSALCDALLARGDAVVGLTRDPGKARNGNPGIELARLGADPGTPAGRRPSRASTASSTWSARRSTSAGPTRRSRRSWRAAAPAPTTWSARSPASSSARRCWSTSRRSATTATAATRSSTSRPGRAARASTPRSSRSGRRRRARPRRQACGW